MYGSGKGGRVNGNLNNGKRSACVHQRLVDDHVNEHGRRAAHPVCRECGEVIHDPVKVEDD